MKPLVLWNVRRRRLIAVTDVSGQPTGLLFKGQVLLLETVHELTPRCRAVIQKLTLSQRVKKSHVHNSPSADPILRQMNPINAPPPSYLFILTLLPSHLLLRAPRGPFASGFPIKILHAFLFTPTRAIFPVLLILLDLTRFHVIWRGI